MAKGKVLQTVIDISGEISPTLGKTLDGVIGQLEGVNLKALAAGGAIAGIAVATGKMLVEGTKYLAGLGDAYNSAVNDIAAGTGLVGEELDGMSEVLKDVYGSNFGESMEDAAAGITAVYQATGLAGDALAETTKGAYALSDTFGYDIAESARAAKAMMTNFGVSGEEAMGLIAAGAQNGLDYSGELIDSISEYSVQFAKLGFSADEMFSVFQQGADSGAWNLDKVGDAVKEFSIRSIDGSKTTTEAFEALGLDAENMMATFAAGGDEASYAFQGVLAALMGMDDAVQRDAIGVSLFGTQWEDLGTEAMSALLNMESGAYDAEDALGKINAVKYNNLNDAFEGIKRQAEVSLLPLASTVANTFMQIAPIIGELFKELEPVITETVDLLMPITEVVLGELMGAVRQLMPYVSQFARTLLPVLAEAVGQIFGAISPLIPILLDLTISLLPPLMSIIQALMPVVMLVFDVLSPVIGLVAQLVTALLPPLTTLINALIPIIDALALVFSSSFGAAIEAIRPLLTGLTTILSDLISFITNVFTGNWEGAWSAAVNIFKGIFNTIPAIAESVINAIIGIINGIIKGINSVGATFDVSIPLIPTVTLPRFATGGITDGLSIAGEDPNYPNEYIISLNPAYRKQNLAYWAEAGRMLNADYSDFALGGASGGVSIDIGGVTFAPNITVTGHADKTSIMEAIEAEYPEFLDMLEEYLVERGALVYG